MNWEIRETFQSLKYFSKYMVKEKKIEEKKENKRSLLRVGQGKNILTQPLGAKQYFQHVWAGSPASII